MLTDEPLYDIVRGLSSVGSCSVVCFAVSPGNALHGLADIHVIENHERPVLCTFP